MDENDRLAGELCADDVVRELMDRMRALYEARAAWRGSPAGQAALAERVGAEERARKLALERQAREAGIPKGEAIQAIALAEAKRSTDAMRVVSAALDRAAQGEAGSGTPYTLVLLGPTGTGKTVALAWLAAHWPGGAQYLHASRVPDPRTDMTRLPFGMQDELAVLADRLMTVPLLCVDEIGMERDPTTIEYWASRRWDDGLVTVMAGNQTLDVLLQRYRDPRFSSRILAHGALEELTDGDLRRRVGR